MNNSSSPWLHRKRRQLHKKIFRWLNGDCPRPLGVLFQHDPAPFVPEIFPQPDPSLKLPRICLVTPSFQQAPFIERTLRSVLDQGYPNLSYGVQDGGSTDGTASILERYANQLTFMEMAPDHGQADAIQRGFEKLKPKGDEIMAWLNSDDVLSAGTLYFIGEYFARNPRVDVVYGHRIILNESDREVGRWFIPRHHDTTLKWFDFVPQETLFWRAKCFDAIGGLDISFKFAMDWDFLLRLAESGFKIKRLPYFLGCFRVHEKQKTKTQINTIGEEEIQRLRLRTLGRPITDREKTQNLDREQMQSALIAWLFRRGIRW